VADIGDPVQAARLKEDVARFWEAAACGEVYAAGASLRERMDAHARARYAMEPFIPSFARFAEGRGRHVLEIGVGLGADHVEWAKAAPRCLVGIDLTRRAVDLTRSRLGLYGLRSSLLTADAERLPFRDDGFDLVYSWGVLHHSPDTPRAIEEVWRVLRPGGRARVMIYHRASIVGGLLWARYGLAAGTPWRSLEAIYARYLESPGTKAYSIPEAHRLFRGFSRVRSRIELSNGDLLEGAAGQRHAGPMLTLARRVWPRTLLRRAGRRLGLFLLIDAVK
jgi:SAM-dependent methyltransferase